MLQYNSISIGPYKVQSLSDNKITATTVIHISLLTAVVRFGHKLSTQNDILY